MTKRELELQNQPLRECLAEILGLVESCLDLTSDVESN